MFLTNGLHFMYFLNTYWNKDSISCRKIKIDTVFNQVGTASYQHCDDTKDAE
jgi:hypothetical protein